MTLVERYQKGGDLFAAIEAQYGTDAATYVAARAGDTVTLNYALSDIRTSQRTGTPVATVAGEYFSGSTSTLGNFASQIANDPLAAPLAAANDQLQKAVGNVFKNPMVLLVVVGAVLFFVSRAGGFAGLKRRVTG